MQLHYPRAVGLGEDVALGANVSQLVFLELWTVSIVNSAKLGMRLLGPFHV